MAVEPSINLQLKPGMVGCVTSMKATEAMYPSIIPNAVHICHIITNAPRMMAGEHSAPYTGVVVDLAPTAKPRRNRASSRFHQVCAAAIQKDEAKDMKHEMKMHPRRPNQRFRGAVVQHPISAEHKYGAPLRSPCCHLLVTLNSAK